MPAGSFREVVVSTTVPQHGLAKRIGVFAFSDTPDPGPSNNCRAGIPVRAAFGEPVRCMPATHSTILEY
jgi:hypothetical protein